MRLELSEKADSDLREIYKYSYRQFGDAQAERYYESLWTCFRLIADNPHLGRPRSEFQPPARSHHHKNHVIFYDVYDDRIVIIRVLHKRMEIDKHMRS